jgi:hypothetical protein
MRVHGKGGAARGSDLGASPTRMGTEVEDDRGSHLSVSAGDGWRVRAVLGLKGRLGAGRTRLSLRTSARFPVDGPSGEAGLPSRRARGIERFRWWSLRTSA